MGFFSSKEYDPNAEKAKKEAKKAGLARKDVRKVYRLTKGEEETLRKELLKKGKTKLADATTGKFDEKVLSRIGTYRQRIRNGKCPLCGEPPEKRRHICNSCKGGISQLPSIDNVDNGINMYNKAGENTINKRWDEEGFRWG